MAVMRERGAGAGGAPAGTAGAAAAGAPTATAAAPSPDQVTSADIFAVIADYVAHHPELVGHVGSVF